MNLKIVGAREFALWKGFFERAVVTEAWRDVSPFGEERFVGRAASHVAADGHRANSAAVIALPPRENAVTILLAALEVKLACKFDGGFGCFGTSRCEINAAAVVKIRRSHREQAIGKFFRRSSVELRRVRESNLRRLLGHGATDFQNAMTDADDGSLPGSIEESAPVVGDNPASFPASSDGKGLLEVAGEESAAGRHEMSGEGL